MRILFLTRIHPLKNLGPIEARLHDRLTELSELGHEVLVLTKWTGDPIDFQLPKRIEIRSPFKTFRPWEWPKALPLVFAWRPELLHVFDPGLSTLERTLSVEMLAMTMLDTLKLGSRGRSTYRGSLVSVINEPGGPAQAHLGWKQAGAKLTESNWLSPGGAGNTFKPWDPVSDRKIRVVLAGEIGRERLLEHVFDALQVMRLHGDFELTIFLERTKLSSRDRSRLALAERSPQLAGGSDVAVGSRLKIAAPDLAAKTADDFDVAIVAGLEVDLARTWIERLALPIVLSEMQAPILAELERAGMSAQVMGPLVTEIASIAMALRQAVDRTRSPQALHEAWHTLEQGALVGGRDVAANQISRLYSQIAGTDSNPYS